MKKSAILLFPAMCIAENLSLHYFINFPGKRRVNTRGSGMAYRHRHGQSQGKC